MNEMMESFSHLDATQVLWIAGGVGALFVFFIVFDAIRQHRRNHRRPRLGRAARADLKRQQPKSRDRVGRK